MQGADVFGVGTIGSPAGRLIPSGLIAMWKGSVATIPAGWALCDGSNGTPDLRDKFVVGADADVAGVAESTVAGAAAQSRRAASTTTSSAGSHQHTDPASGAYQLQVADMPSRSHATLVDLIRNDAAGSTNSTGARRPGATSSPALVSSTSPAAGFALPPVRRPDRRPGRPHARDRHAAAVVRARVHHEALGGPAMTDDCSSSRPPFRPEFTPQQVWVLDVVAERAANKVVDQPHAARVPASLSEDGRRLEVLLRQGRGRRVGLDVRVPPQPRPRSPAVQESITWLKRTVWGRRARRRAAARLRSSGALEQLIRHVSLRPFRLPGANP